ncbi:hypothetical protein GCM10011571_15630 [Marinithermofilum abyssi]|uniref:Uncharacterized protein n=1 Tax=Marinithermofilum abyssi TaxID=1571185 RepID=A0A8J2VHK9_9BACL|nr:hypothetical protein GCM10011571_15630 [Marinithermofilum abyssi]
MSFVTPWDPTTTNMSHWRTKDRSSPIAVSFFINSERENPAFSGWDEDERAAKTGTKPIKSGPAL